MKYFVHQYLRKKMAKNFVRILPIHFVRRDRRYESEFDGIIVNFIVTVLLPSMKQVTLRVYFC